MQNDISVNINLDLTRSRGSKVVYARRGDTKIYTLHVMLTNNGKVVDLTNAVAVMFYLKQPDETENVSSMQRNGNDISYTLTTEDLDTLGDSVAQIYVGFMDGTKFVTPEFTITVYDPVIDTNLGEVEVPGSSENYYTALSDLLAQTITLEESASEASDEAVAAKDEAAQIVVDVKGWADVSKAYAETAEANVKEVSDSVDRVIEASEKIDYALSQQEAIFNETQAEIDSFRATADEKANEVDSKYNASKELYDQIKDDADICEASAIAAIEASADSVSNAQTAKQYYEGTVQAAEDAIVLLRNSISADIPTFDYDESTGHLSYTGGKFNFAIVDGHLTYSIA